MLTGGPGDDDLDGGEGYDTASYAESEEGVQIDLTSDDIRSEGDGARDTFESVENLEGSAYDDMLTGDGGNNTLTGLAGADTLKGGAGSDTASYAGSPDGVVVSIAEVDTGTTPDALTGGHAAGDVIVRDEDVDHDGDGEDGTTKQDVSSIENLTGSGGNDNLTGDYRANVLKGGEGADEINGGAGDDTIEGGIGNDDPLTGGMGDDNIDGGAGNDTITGNEGDDTLTGGMGDDNIDGGAGNDTLTGGAGTDTLEGGMGSDTYHADAEDTITEVTDTDDATCDDKTTTPLVERCEDAIVFAAYKRAATDEDQTTGFTEAVPANVEVLHATRYNDEITSNSDDGATILGHEGDDMITGGEGADVLVGCAGKNTLTSGAGNDGDVFGVFNDGENADTIADFTDGDEIHLKDWAMDAVVDVVQIAGNSENVSVTVDGVPVATVASTTIIATDVTATDPARSKTENMVLVLKGENDMREDVTRIVDFDAAKCSSPE
jgi:Ca2+-binding RTX toxin-like protein